MSAGTLAAAVATPIEPVNASDPRWSVTWLPIPNPNPTRAETATRLQVPATTAFNGGEGCWYDTDTVYLTTKGDNRVWALNAATSVLELVYDDNLAASPVLTGVDNVKTARSRRCAKTARRSPANGGPPGVPAADTGLVSGLVHGAVEPPVRSVAAPVADVVHAVDRGLAGLGL